MSDINTNSQRNLRISTILHIFVYALLVCVLLCCNLCFTKKWNTYFSLLGHHVRLTSSLITLKSKGCRWCKEAWLSPESNYTWLVLLTKILCLIDHGWEQRPMKILAKRFHPTIRCETESHQCWKSPKHISNWMCCKRQKPNRGLTLPNERFWGTLMHCLWGLCGLKKEWKRKLR